MGVRGGVISKVGLLSLAVGGLFVGGCAVRSSSFAPLAVMAEGDVEIHQAGLPKAQIGCGWVTVDEKVVTKFFGLPISTNVRQFERALFYCCPGESDPDPRCYQADWFYRSDQ